MICCVTSASYSPALSPILSNALCCALIVDKNINLRDSFVYGTVEQQLLYVKIYKHFWDLRDKLLKEKNGTNEED